MKYIIEIKPEYEDSFKGVMILGAKDSNLFVDTLAVENIEELTSDYINEHFGDLQDTAYQRGLYDAWEAAKKIALMDTETSENVTGYFGLFRIMENLTPMQAIEKLKAYEEKKSEDEIKVGDTVDLKDAVSDKRGGIVTKLLNDDYCYIVWYDGSGGVWAKDMLVKTGKHIDIASILEDMRNE